MQSTLGYSFIGKKFRNIKGELCHVVNEFIDDNDDIITYKKWSKRVLDWNYYTDYKEIFMVQFKYGAKWINK